MLVRSGALDVVVIDSVAALTPRAEIEGEMGDTHVGLQARLMSQALRKLTANLNKTKTIMIFINQLREKIGVMFGCMSYGTRVTLADGTQEKIGKIVNQKLPVEVLSYDFERGELVAKPVTNWFDNGVAERFLQFTVERGGGNGQAQFAATENHLISTPGGWRPAGELIVGDRVLQAATELLSDVQWQVLLGGLMGDGALSPTRSGNGARFRWGHGAKQAAYGDWKASLFANVDVSRSTERQGCGVPRRAAAPELAELREAVYVGGKKVLSDDYLKQLTPLSLAVWYMDDGGVHAALEGTAGAHGGRQRPRRDLRRGDVGRHAALGSRATSPTRGASTCSSSPAGSAEGGAAVPDRRDGEVPGADRSVRPSVDGVQAAAALPRPVRRRAGVRRAAPGARRRCAITQIAVKPPTRSMHKFDLEVGGTHNYFVDGVMVHNSPETTPGGRALKFYSSVRLDIRRIESLKDGAEVVGNRTRVKVVKNKVAPPFRQAEFDIMYGKGISREGSLLDMAVDMGIVKKSGAWFTYEGEQLGQGRENAKAFLTGNPEIMVEISDKVLTPAGLRPDSAEEDGGRYPRRLHPCRRRPDRARLTRTTSSRVGNRQADRRSSAGLEHHQPEDHDEAEVGDAEAGGEHRAGALAPVSERWADEEPADGDEDDPEQERGDDPAIGHLEHLSDNPTSPMPNTHTSTRAGRLSRRCHLATSAPAPTRSIDG